MKALSTFALPIFAATTFLTGGCVSRDVSKDPVKGLFAGGDGSWDSGSRKWTVYLGRGETKSATFRLQNTSSEDYRTVFQAPAVTPPGTC